MARLFGEAKEEQLVRILARALGKGRLSRTLAPVPLSAWSDAVGPALAARARPTALSRGVLHLAVQDHRWRDQIDAVRGLILDRLNLRLGAGSVRALQLGPAPQLPPEAMAALPTAGRNAGKRTTQEQGAGRGTGAPDEMLVATGAARACAAILGGATEAGAPSAQRMPFDVGEAFVRAACAARDRPPRVRA